MTHRTALRAFLASCGVLWAVTAGSAPDRAPVFVSAPATAVVASGPSDPAGPFTSSASLDGSQAVSLVPVPVLAVNVTMSDGSAVRALARDYARRMGYARVAFTPTLTRAVVYRVGLTFGLAATSSVFAGDRLPGPIVAWVE